MNACKIACNFKLYVTTTTDVDFNWPIMLVKDVKNLVYGAGKRQQVFHYMTAWSYRTAGNGFLHVGIKIHLTKQDP